VNGGDQWERKREKQAQTEGGGGLIARKSASRGTGLVGDGYKDSLAGKEVFVVITEEQAPGDTMGKRRQSQNWGGET